MTIVRTRPEPPRIRTRSRGMVRRSTIVASVLLHLVALTALLFGIPPREEPITPEPSYALVFDNGGSPDRSTSPVPAEETPPSEPTPAQPAPAEPAPPVQTPEAQAPAPMPESPPETEPMPPPPPAAAQPESAPAPAEAAPVLPAPPVTVPEELAPNPAVPDVRLETPPPLTPGPTAQSLVPELSLTPPPPLPALPRPAPRPAPPTQMAQRRPAPDPNRFPDPIDLNFGPAASRAPAAPRGSVASRAIDLSPGAAKAGPNKSEAFFDARAAKIGADWANGLATYWRAHRYYPRQAIEAGEDGSVQVELVVNRLGKVESVQIKTRSGSPWLDMAAVGTWRNAQLAPFPRENTDATATITLTINYILLR